MRNRLKWLSLLLMLLCSLVSYAQENDGDDNSDSGDDSQAVSATVPAISKLGDKKPEGVDESVPQEPRDN